MSQSLSILISQKGYQIIFFNFMVLGFLLYCHIVLYYAPTN